MTTIVTDGKFVISDTRASRKITATQDTGRERFTKTHRILTDDEVKIFCPAKLRVMGEEVACLAFSGTGFHQERYLELDKLNATLSLEMMAIFLQGMSCGSDKLSSHTLIMTKSGHIYTLRIDQRGRYQCDFIKIEIDEGKFLVLGSGFHAWKPIRDRLKEPVSALDVFFYCAHMDPASSDRYSAYSLEDHHLFTNIHPAASVVEQGIDNIVKKIKYFDPSIKPLAIPDHTE